MNNHCSFCPMSFKYAMQLQQHLRQQHPSERPHVCQYCQSRFSQQSHLTTHERTHTGERPYVCQYCQSRFTRQSNLTAHERTHTGERPHVCQYCQNRFTRKHNLTAHERTRHPGEYAIGPQLNELLRDPANQFSRPAEQLAAFWQELMLPPQVAPPRQLSLPSIDNILDGLGEPGPGPSWKK